LKIGIDEFSLVYIAFGDKPVVSFPFAGVVSLF
jgi:hypothetical protein